MCYTMMNTSVLCFMFCIKITWIRKVQNVDMYGWMKHILPEKCRFWQFLPSKHRRGWENGALQHIRQRISKKVSHLCYLGLPALYMYYPVDSEDVDFYSPPLIIPYSYTHNIMLVWLTLTKWSWLWWSGLLSLINSSILYLPMNLIKRN